MADSVRQLCSERIDPFVGQWFERGEIDGVRGLAKELGAPAGPRSSTRRSWVFSACTWRAMAVRG